jgi:hypothetical protein
MRVMALIAAALVLVSSAPASAQDEEWIEFSSAEDGFRVNFPGQPKVETTTYQSEYGYSLPARIYRAQHGQERYSMTVVDYRNIEAQALERSKNCPPGNQPCGANAGGLNGAGRWKQDVRGAITYATFKMLQRDAKLTHLLWNWTDLVEGQYVQLTNPDQSRTFAGIHMHENRLYIQEGTVPKGSPQPMLFQQSMGFVDKDGNGIRYQTVYSNTLHGLREAPLPARAGRGRGAGAGGAAGAGAQGAGGGAGPGAAK